MNSLQTEFIILMTLGYTVTEKIQYSKNYTGFPKKTFYSKDNFYSASGP